ncbi:hypothetical protein LRD18_06400 [Halorhodospira halochloris]|uniref:Uncharacterized protein n=1 Tax=Halorhodospira halochloris TaxID=1052 RepID=A0A0X8X9D5_HALHR|nr:hypothetical protein [Halorhodospira halochloris]MBK1652659.1 hypothetical protein [Halorhodospira halochloris]MCG5530502.1 hypothetical protein [Halorhodospira halochloris]MCG5548842.1 hypothetical protein [Halorhodospira halochloris]BAU57886.1 hypothetical protein HH1059_11920 [Halorhodospira halochloris]
MGLFFPNWLTNRGKNIIQDLQRGRISIPIPESALAAVVSQIDEPSVSDLALSIAANSQLIFTGRKKIGPWWIPFSATFSARAPAAGAPPQSIDLKLERTSPSLAYPFALKALGKREEFEVVGSRVLVDIGKRIKDQDWARYLPDSVLSHIRVVEISSDSDARQLKVALAVKIPDESG